MLGDGLVGVDLDQVRNPHTGSITAMGQAVIKTLDSYTEISPSHAGIHVLVHGSLPPGRRRHAHGIEMYSDSRYFTITGQHLPETPTVIHERTEQLRVIHTQVFRRTTRPTTTMAPEATSSVLTDAALLAKAMTAVNGARFAALWAGDLSAYDGDESAADLALANLLAFWTGRDAGQIDRLFQQSGLMRPKWTSRRRDSTYGALTIEKAIAECRDVYTPGLTVEIIDDATDNDAPMSEPSPIATTADGWPRLHQDAFIGLFGDLVHAIAPCTEADPVALLGHGLASWGNLVGRTPHALVGTDTHHANENVAIVGSTSSGRKGTAWSPILKIMADVDGDWAASRVQTGLSTGKA